MAATLPHWAQAQEKALDNARVTVGFPAGDMADNIARLFSEQIRGKYAENVIVDNKPGAAARVAIQSFIKYRADGSEALFTPGAMIVLFPHVFQQLPYDPIKDLRPVGKIGNTAFGLAVGPGCPADIKTLADYLAWAKKDPKNASYATSGAGTGIHLTAEYLAVLSNTPLNMVPYKGGAPAAADLVAGQIPSQMATIPSLIEHARAGKVRFLAVSSGERHRLLPNVPTFKELGYSQLVTDDWFGFFLPASASSAQAESMHRAINNALRDPKVVAHLENMGLTVGGTATTTEFADLVTGEFKRWGEIARTVKFQPMG
jgi:tripartite-type tricarboxylate transporter receptor subunit TctC